MGLSSPRLGAWLLLLLAAVLLMVPGCPSPRPGEIAASPAPEVTRPTPAPSASPGAPSSSQIVWEPSLAEAQRKAADSGKPLVVDVGAEWCGWCKKLDKDTWPSPDVTAFTGDFVWVKVDDDRDKSMSNKYKIQGLPTILVLRGESVVARQEGYLEAGDMASFLKSALAKAKAASPTGPAPAASPTT